MTQYYECHITVEGNKELAEHCIAAFGWKFSAIDGDPSLGDGVKCYATIHYNNRVPLVEVIDRVQSAAKKLRNDGLNVVREKVEMVVYDTRSKSVNPF